MCLIKLSDYYLWDNIWHVDENSVNTWIHVTLCLVGAPANERDRVPGGTEVKYIVDIEIELVNGRAIFQLPLNVVGLSGDGAWFSQANAVEFFLYEVFEF